MNAAEELRAAATTLREKAKFAADGPWTCSPVWSPDSHATSGVYSNAYPTGTPESEVVASGGKGKAGFGGIRNPHNALWITLMQPAIAEPLADLLEFLSGVAEYAVKSGRAETIVDDYALTVARAINGGA